ncbi:TPA: hypothetical protein L4S00_002654 [Pseudomonas aeruginosa]|nr:hypothetical protein [Pseudomonas aeruginosa]HBO4700052.1 hypothetical protein [Pseudomonas aeruginosa]
MSLHEHGCFSDSYQVKHINAQCVVGTVFRHKPTNRRYIAVLEAGGSVELQEASGHSTYASIEALGNAEVWENVK